LNQANAVVPEGLLVGRGVPSLRTGLYGGGREDFRSRSIETIQNESSGMHRTKFGEGSLGIRENDQIPDRFCAALDIILPKLRQVT
jgi:hypothetical protein